MHDARFVVKTTQGLLAHRSPFLFVDEGEISNDERRAWGRHRFSADEPFFVGHFPGDPIVHGVILLEMAAQTANLLLSHRARRQVRGHLVAIDEAKFNLPVRPNQTVTVDVQFAREAPSNREIEIGSMVGFKATGYLENRRCMRAAVYIYQAGFGPDQPPA